MIRPLGWALVFCTFSTSTICADEFPWPAADKLPQNMTLLPAGQAVDQPILKVVGPTLPNQATMLEVANPKVASHIYVLRGQIKYDGVEPFGYLEMWSHFGDKEAYFSRTLASVGPLGKLEGMSDWREVMLPFESVPGKLPTKLVVNVILPGKGTVFLKPFTLTSGAVAPSAGRHEWWSERTTGLIGGIGGGLFGLLGATIGTLAGIGVARRTVIGLCVFVIVAGALALLAGVTIVCLGQPWHVYYPFLLGGAIAVPVCGLNLPAIRKRYDALELRRMAAMDA